MRAARALIRWDQSTLAARAGVSVETVKRLEKMQGQILGATGTTLSKIQSALESAGVTFLDGAYSGAGGPGVRLTAPVASTVDADDSEVIQYPEYKSKGGVGGSGG